jgi:hypothetical protein
MSGEPPGGASAYAAAQRAQISTETAANLQALLSAPLRAGDAQLNAAGTNYYVRSYVGQPSAPQNPLVAKALSLPVSLKAGPEGILQLPPRKAGAKAPKHVLGPGSVSTAVTGAVVK